MLLLLRLLVLLLLVLLLLLLLSPHAYSHTACAPKVCWRFFGKGNSKTLVNLVGFLKMN